MKTEDMNTDLGGSLIYLTSKSSRVTCLLEPGMLATVTDTGPSDGFSLYIVLGRGQLLELLLGTMAWQH